MLHRHRQRTPPSGHNNHSRRETGHVQTRTESHINVKESHIHRSLFGSGEMHTQGGREGQTQLGRHAPPPDRPIRGRNKQPGHRSARGRNNGGRSWWHKARAKDKASSQLLWPATSNRGSRTRHGSIRSQRSMDKGAYRNTSQILNAGPAITIYGTHRTGYTQDNQSGSK